MPYDFAWIKWSREQNWKSPSLLTQLLSNWLEAATVNPAKMPPDVDEIDGSRNNDNEPLDDAEEHCVHLDNSILVGRRLNALYNNS